MNPLSIVLGAVALLVIALVLSFNRFISQRNLVRESWANVDTELKRRYDLIPNLVATVKGYAAHEASVLQAVTTARAAAAATSGPAEAQAPAEQAFVSSLRQLWAVAENYPDLKASDQFLALQRELTTTEDRIQLARRFYNGNVRDLNRRVDSFPSNLMASVMGVTKAQYFEVEPAVRVAPSASFGPPDGDPGAER
jgi:LemA protein